MAEAKVANQQVSLDEVVALCKRRGFIFQASEIYGGLASTYDYGHYGVLLKNNVKAEWWRAMVGERDDIVALDSAILQHPRVWEASGHLEGFTDPLVDCLVCQERFRAELQRQLREVGVARSHEPVVHRDGAVGVPIEHVVAHGAAAWNAHADTAVRETAARELFLREPEIAPQRRRGGDQLERGAGRIGPVSRPVEERALAGLRDVGRHG